MTNEIEDARASTARTLKSAKPVADASIVEVSPCGRYRLETQEFATDDGREVVVATVWRTEDAHELTTVQRNDSRCFYGWVQQGKKSFLLFPEDLEGQTVIDLATGKVAGFTSRDNPFIWTEFHTSPDQQMLAVVGCYWACPYQVTVYDFRYPMELPLPRIAEFQLPENDAKFVAWVGNAACKIQSNDGTVRLFDVPGQSET
jgi:hypothetical protein